MERLVERAGNRPRACGENCPVETRDPGFGQPQREDEYLGFFEHPPDRAQMLRTEQVELAVGERVVAKSGTEGVDHAGVRVPAVFGRFEGSQAATQKLEKLPGRVDIAVCRAEVLVAEILRPNARERWV